MGHTLFQVTGVSVGSHLVFPIGEVPACRSAEPGLGGLQGALEPCCDHPNPRVSLRAPRQSICLLTKIRGQPAVGSPGSCWEWGEGLGWFPHCEARSPEPVTLMALVHVVIIINAATFLSQEGSMSPSTCQPVRVLGPQPSKIALLSGAGRTAGKADSCQVLQGRV